MYMWQANMFRERKLIKFFVLQIRYLARSHQPLNPINPKGLRMTNWTVELDNGRPVVEAQVLPEPETPRLDKFVNFVKDFSILSVGLTLGAIAYHLL